MSTVYRNTSTRWCKDRPQLIPHQNHSHKGLAPTGSDRKLGWECRGRKDRLRNIRMGGKGVLQYIIGTAGPKAITSSWKQKRIPIHCSTRCSWKAQSQLYLNWKADMIGDILARLRKHPSLYSSLWLHNTNGTSSSNNHHEGADISVDT